MKRVPAVLFIIASACAAPTRLTLTLAVPPARSGQSEATVVRVLEEHGYTVRGFGQGAGCGPTVRVCELFAERASGKGIEEIRVSRTSGTAWVVYHFVDWRPRSPTGFETREDVPVRQSTATTRAAIQEVALRLGAPLAPTALEALPRQRYQRWVWGRPVDNQVDQALRSLEFSVSVTRTSSKPGVTPLVYWRADRDGSRVGIYLMRSSICEGGPNLSCWGTQSTRFAVGAIRLDSGGEWTAPTSRDRTYVDRVVEMIQGR